MIVKYNDAEDIYRFIEKKVTYPCNHDDSRPEKKDDDRRARLFSPQEWKPVPHFRVVRRDA